MSMLLAGQTSARLNYRKVRQADFEIWLPFFQDPRTSLHWNLPNVSPEQLCKDWYQYQFYRYAQGLGGMNAMVEKHTGDLVGHCGLLIQEVDGQQELEIGYSLLPDYWGNGYATEAAITCRDHAFIHDLSDSVVSIISTTNLSSEKVARANGMSLDHQTVYKSNQVNIFRIKRAAWLSLKSLDKR